MEEKWEEKKVGIALKNSQWNILAFYLAYSTEFREKEKETWERLSLEVEGGKPKYKNAAGNAEFWRNLNREIEEMKKIINER